MQPKETILNESDQIAEGQVIGCLLFEPERAPEVALQLQAEDFGDPFLKMCFESLQELSKTGSADVPTLAEKIHSQMRGSVDLAAIWPKLHDLQERTVATTTLDHYVDRVSERARIRRQGYLFAEGIKAAQRRDLQAVQKAVISLSKEQDGERIAEAITLTEAARKHAEWHRKLESKEIKTFDTGLKILDSDLNSLYGGGMLAGQLGIIGGRTGAGKTTFATWVAVQIAIIDPDVRCHIFSLELKPEHIAAKAVQMAKKRAGIREGAKSEQALKAVQSMQSWGDRITVSEERTPAQILARARKMSRQKGVSLFVLDHLHRIKLQDSRGNSARFEYGEFCRDITDQAKEDDCLWLVAGQLNRDSAKESRAPELRDLCESAMIEQHSDFVIGMHYPDKKSRRALRLHLLKNRWGTAAVWQAVTMDWQSQSVQKDL